MNKEYWEEKKKRKANRESARERASDLPPIEGENNGSKRIPTEIRMNDGRQAGPAICKCLVVVVVFVPIRHPLKVVRCQMQMKNNRNDEGRRQSGSAKINSFGGKMVEEKKYLNGSI